MARDLGHAGLPRVGIKICYCLTDFHSTRCGMTLMARKTHLREEPLAIPKGGVDPSDVEVCDLSSTPATPCSSKTESSTPPRRI